MNDDVKPYKKTLEDELDWKLLDQLHSTVSQISSFCFEIKKFCVTTTFVVLTLLVKFTSDKLDNSLFVAGILIPLCFWFLDSIGYYYQVKIRGTMETIRKNILARNSDNIVASSGERIISEDRVNRPWYLKVNDSVVNHSMWLYLFMISMDLVVWGLFCFGDIS
jgi:hypothetical protein